MQTDLSERKQKILEAIVNDYIYSAIPVGSKNLRQKHHLDLSPATIRNEMSDLEREGYILQPHTSAGRIPSDKGYRYYVDNLMRTRSLKQKEEELIKQAYRNLMADAEIIAHQTLQVTSALTHYAAVMMVEKEDGSERIWSFGISNIVSFPEFNNAKNLKHILRIFEEEALLSNILHEYVSEGDPISIKIGSENRYREMRDCSVVASPIKTSQKEIGSIAVIGPTRMLYSRVASIIERLSGQLSLMFGGEENDG